MSRAGDLRSSPRMFESDRLDRLTRVHPAVPAIVFAPAIAVLTVLGFRDVSPPAGLALMLGGYVAWTLTEYWMHRLVFHFEPNAGLGARVHWMIHGVHHDHPGDRSRLVMPPVVSVPLALAFFGLFTLALGTPEAYPFTAGFVTGYVAYDVTHYRAHHARPRTRVGRLVRELHMRHHFEDDTRGFGVSAPYWDRVFGTASQRGRSLRR